MHHAVLLHEAVNALNIKPKGVYIDGTFGRGGHSQAMLKYLQDGQLLVIDKDPAAILHAQQLFGRDARITIIHGSFTQMNEVVHEKGLVGKVSGILFDLGVSSPQLDEGERGFSFMREGALDMRMDNSQGLSAEEWLAHVQEKELAEVLFTLGEERYAKRIARAIVEARQHEPLNTTKVLAEVIAKAHPNWEKHKHPATKSFQAIRIYINRELADLDVGLEQSIELLEKGGRLAVISFHSLEDRIVKQFIHLHEKGPALPRGLPVSEKEIKKHQKLKAVGRAIKPSGEEVNRNPRARSAVLRVAERV